MTLTLGPLALPVAPLLLLGFLVLTVVLARAISPREERPSVDSALWTSALAGLVIGRLGHLALHLEAYRDHPLNGIDIRDGGFLPLPGLIGGAAVLVWMLRSSRSRTRSRVLALAIVAGALWWFAATALAQKAVETRPPLADLPVRLWPLTMDATIASETPSQTLLQIAQREAARPMVVNLWATWCPPCRAEMPVFQRLQNERPDIRFVFVNQGEAAETVRSYLQREGLNLPEMWLDPASALGPAMGSSGLPTTLLFDAQGRLLKKHLGVLNESSLRILLGRTGRSP